MERGNKIQKGNRAMTITTRKTVGIVGHCCGDLKPLIPDGVETNLERALPPGGLVETNGIELSIGGALKTGLTTRKLGVPTKLVGVVGDDWIGKALIDLLKEVDPVLAETIVVRRDHRTSNSIVLELLGRDRTFLHDSGANNLFSFNDIPWTNLGDISWFHFGYLTLMKKMFLKKGFEAGQMFRQAKKMGMTTSLDITMIDPKSEAGRQDWVRILESVLPDVDVFLPSQEEILQIFFRLHGVDLGVKKIISKGLGSGEAIIQRLFGMGIAIFMVKLGRNGLYVRVTDDKERLRSVGKGASDKIVRSAGQEFAVPAFRVNAVRTTGAGDRAIAGFIAAMLRGYDVGYAAKLAAVCGAYSVSQEDPRRADPSWRVARQQMKKWQYDQVNCPFSIADEWHWSEVKKLWIGPNDPSRS